MILYFIDWLCKMIGMDTQKNVHPAYTYIETVTKRASEEGLKLNISSKGFVWKDADGKIFGDGQVWTGLNLAEMMHQACIFIDDHRGWKITG